MNTRALSKYAGAVVALAVLSACAGGSNVAPSASTRTTTYVGKTMVLNGRPITAERLTPLPRYASLVPAIRPRKFEYIFNYYGTYGSIFDYPKSTQMIDQITGAGGQGCTNKLHGYGQGIIWNAGRTNDLITEYKVPKKVIKTLSLPYTFTSSCAMNTSGDLAVGVLLGNSYGPGGQVAIWKGATGSPTVYNTPLAREYFNGYDANGNMFADGFGPDYYFGLVELPAGGKTFRSITTSNTVQFPGSVQWDGKFLTVFDQDTSETYRYHVKGTVATLKNTIQYTGASDCAQTWIVQGLMYCADAGNNNGEVFNYPAGGAPIATFTGNFDLPLGVTAARR